MLTAKDALSRTQRSAYTGNNVFGTYLAEMVAETCQSVSVACDQGVGNVDVTLVWRSTSDFDGPRISELVKNKFREIGYVVTPTEDDISTFNLQWATMDEVAVFTEQAARERSRDSKKLYGLTADMAIERTKKILKKRAEDYSSILLQECDSLIRAECDSGETTVLFQPVINPVWGLSSSSVLSLLQETKRRLEDRGFVVVREEDDLNLKIYWDPSNSTYIEESLKVAQEL